MLSIAAPPRRGRKKPSREMARPSVDAAKGVNAVQNSRQSPLRSRQGFCLGLAALIAVTLGVRASGADAAEKLKIGTLMTLGAGPLYVGIDRGYFAKEGFDIELVRRIALRVDRNEYKRKQARNRTARVCELSATHEPIKWLVSHGTPLLVTGLAISGESRATRKNCVADASDRGSESNQFTAEQRHPN